MGKVDRQWTPSQLSSVRYLFSDYTHDDDIGFVGGLTLPSAGLQVNYLNNFFSWNHRSVMSNALNELGVMVGRMRADWRTLDSGPRVIVTDRGATLAVLGGVSDNFFWTETDLQLRNVYSRVAGRHTIKAGGDLLRAGFDIRSGPGARGAYTVDLEGRQIQPSGSFLALGDIPRDVRVLSYSQSFVNPVVDATQNLLAFFAEDAIRVQHRRRRHRRPALGLRLGDQYARRRCRPEQPRAARSASRGRPAATRATRCAPATGCSSSASRSRSTRTRFSTTRTAARSR